MQVKSILHNLRLVNCILLSLVFHILLLQYCSPFKKNSSTTGIHGKEVEIPLIFTFADCKFQPIISNRLENRSFSALPKVNVDISDIKMEWGKTKVEPPKHISNTKTLYSLGHKFPVKKSSYTIKRIKRYYLNEVKERIKMVYPSLREEFRNRVKGKVVIKIEIDPLTGEVLNTQIVEHSKYWILNQAALIAIKRATPFPPLPIEIDRISFIIPIVYTPRIQKEKRITK